MASVDKTFVMMKSIIWPQSWVGKEICWLRLKLSSNLLKRTVFRSSFSEWMLKSPTKIKSTFEVIWRSSNDSNSAQKAEINVMEVDKW